ncbi:MAG: transposase [Nanoarchaeotal virus 1]|nr:MAG: transposase [Nanoarchaeotal virus 1]
MITYKFRAYPTPAQEAKITEIPVIEAKMYNEMIKRVDINNIPDLKTVEKNLRQVIHELESLWKGKIYSKAIYSVEERLIANIKGLIRLRKKGRKVGSLKPKERFDYLFYRQHGFKIDVDGVELSKIGKIKVLFHRPPEGKVKGVGLVKDKDNKWYVYIVCELKPKPLPKTGKVIGIDWGVEKLLTTSDGIAIQNPLILDKLDEKIKRLQKALSRKKRGSKNYEKTRIKLAKLYKYARNLMNDYLHKVTTWLVKNYDVIYVENIKVERLIQINKAKKLRRHILNANYHKFLELLEYKAKLYGKQVIKVSPKNTSKKCSRCGYVNKKLSLDDRVFKCPKCGLEIDRDYNAALNILNAGLGQPKVPVEGKPLLYISFSEGVYSKFPG